MTLRAALFMVCLCALAQPAAAETDVLDVDFGFFPQGTSCRVFNTRGTVTLEVGREIEYHITGDTGRVAFRCTQPDGKSFDVEAGALVPAGPHRRVAIQINQDNHAHVFWDEGGLRRMIVPGILRWRS